MFEGEIVSKLAVGHGFPWIPIAHEGSNQLNIHTNLASQCILASVPKETVNLVGSILVCLEEPSRPPVARGKEGHLLLSWLICKATPPKEGTKRVTQTTGGLGRKNNSPMSENLVELVAKPLQNFHG